ELRAATNGAWRKSLCSMSYLPSCGKLLLPLLWNPRWRYSRNQPADGNASEEKVSNASCKQVLEWCGCSEDERNHPGSGSHAEARQIHISRSQQVDRRRRKPHGDQKLQCRWARG